MILENFTVSFVVQDPVFESGGRITYKINREFESELRPALTSIIYSTPDQFSQRIDLPDSALRGLLRTLNKIPFAQNSLEEKPFFRAAKNTSLLHELLYDDQSEDEVGELVYDDDEYEVEPDIPNPQLSNRLKDLPPTSMQRPSFERADEKWYKEHFKFSHDEAEEFGSSDLTVQDTSQINNIPEAWQTGAIIPPDKQINVNSPQPWVTSKPVSIAPEAWQPRGQGRKWDFGKSAKSMIEEELRTIDTTQYTYWDLVGKLRGKYNVTDHTLYQYIKKFATGKTKGGRRKQHGVRQYIEEALSNMDISKYASYSQIASTLLQQFPHLSYFTIREYAKEYTNKTKGQK